MTEQINIEVKFTTLTDAGQLAGYASVFGGEPDSYGDVIAPGAFRASLAEHKAAGTSPLLLWQHDQAEPIGVWTSLTEDATGLKVAGQLVLETARGREAYALLKAGALNGLSIGYRTRQAERRSAGGRTLQDIELIEISLVSIPAASRARVTSVKAASAATTAAEAAQQRSQPMSGDTNAPAREAESEAARVAALEGNVTTLDTRLKAVEDAVTSVKSSADRIEQKLNRPGAVTETKDAPKAETKAFNVFLRRGQEALQADEVKALRVSDDSAGGYLAPAEFTTEVIKNLVQFSPVRQAARVGNTSAGSVIIPKRTAQPTASWVGETEDRSETQPTYGQVEITVHEAACYVDVSQRLLEDAAVNVESEVALDLAEEFGRLEGAAFIKGDGVKKPMGLLNDAGVAFTATGNASTLGSAPADLLITALYALPAFYRNQSVWMMNGNTLAVIRKLKDGQNNFLWEPSYQAGQPETILGRPVVEAVDMPDIGTGTEPIIFGDFARAYRIFDRVALSVMRDPYTQATKGLVRYHARRRVGADVVLAEAIRKIRCAT